MKKNIPALEIKNLTVAYNEHPVLWDIQATIPQATLLAVVGPNGAGKTTLIKTILGLIKPLAGTISIFGKSNTHNTTPIAYVPQRSSVDWDFPATVLDIVLMGSYKRLGWFARPGKTEYQNAYDALEKVALLPHKNTPISMLSGGEQQRVFLARALVQDASLYLMDEPFIGVDIVTEKTMCLVLNELRNQGKTIVVVHHDLHTVATYFDWALMLNIKQIACGPLDTTLTPELLTAAYGSVHKTLFKTMPTVVPHE